VVTGSYRISTEAYEGPIDLFYDLVVTNRIDPSILSLSALVEGFLRELSEGTAVELEHLSEFVLFLALMCKLKARRVLGAQRESSEEDQVENPDRELWYRLAHATFREAVQELADRLKQRSVLTSRMAGPDWSKVETIPELTFRLDPEKLADLARDVMSRVEGRPDLDHLALDLPTVGEAVEQLWHLIGRTGESSFGQLSYHCADRVEEAAWFMGLMELVRQGRVRLSQVKPGGEIRIKFGSDTTPALTAAGGTL
jgi:segregation and condensation protein A